MMTRRSCLLTALAFASLLVLGCEDSKNPLSDPQSAKGDGRLAGVWRTRNDSGDVSYYHIGCLGEKLPSGVMRVVSTTHSADGKLQAPDQYLLFPTTLGQESYLNLVAAKAEQVKQIEENGWSAAGLGSYLLFKYKFKGDALLVWAIDNEAKRKAIEAGKIKGTVEQRENDTKALFTDSSENVARFVTQAGDSLFAQEVVRLERVK
jgi:hypothetical protein